MIGATKGMKDEIRMIVDIIQIRNSLMRRQRFDGEPGSGNWSHEGRPGQLGGSAAGGGSHNQQSAIWYK